MMMAFWFSTRNSSIVPNKKPSFKTGKIFIFYGSIF
jgi:hypothetical protein